MLLGETIVYMIVKFEQGKLNYFTFIDIKKFK
jgi:hypothetical protein